ncbi:hypothetical protein AJ85_00655 [Alkalihalobacillus alcalophilus ATCC 27647 = CGMCC 1.3604]|uniref:Uncharacterized protein n=1 Tax=Alkalihalobacillus alcalophilus ATCC 27647 = CGMCC 1.3604 TaxID=1218173 RepID=A0A4S4K3U8_ALKAL|nr:hypothetical protein AJ85_00655 [Alkalihalobacillus alcalophilus ATCC 27647 = CGMCC 1.3604]
MIAFVEVEWWLLESKGLNDCVSGSEVKTKGIIGGQ